MAQHDFYSSIEKSAIDIITPVMENAVVLSGHYVKACGRSTILSKDMEYCLKYCAMYTVGDKIGSYFPEIYDEESSDEDEDEDEDYFVDESAEEEQFEPYNGTDEQMIAITEAYNAWESWVPTSPSEFMLKNAIDSNEHIV
jgi:hypothetical protein